MTNRTPAEIVLLMLVQGLTGCGASSSPRPLAGARVEIIDGPLGGMTTTPTHRVGFSLTGTVDDDSQQPRTILMTRFPSLIALLAMLVSPSACGGKDASPTSPGASVFSLSGTVIGYDGGVPGASVTIMDGIHAGQTRTTDGAGKYSFTDLTPSSFTLQVAATDGYLTQNQAVTLTANQSLNFYLSDH